MTRRILFATAVLCAIFAGAALAADISGNWSGTLQMGDNPFTLTYAFKQDGEKLTGTVTGPGGEPLPLNDGKVVGDKVSFNVKVDMGGNPATFRKNGAKHGSSEENSSSHDCNSSSRDPVKLAGSWTRRVPRPPTLLDALEEGGAEIPAALGRDVHGDFVAFDD